MGKRWNKGRRRATPKGALLFLAITFLAGGIWFFNGNVTQTVSLQGIAFPHGGIRRVVAGHGGAVQQVLCRVGDTVEQGDLLAVLPEEELLDAMHTGGSAGELWPVYAQQSLIKAPVNGKIGRMAAVGEVLEVGGIVAEIIEDDPFTNQSELRTYVPARVAAQLLEGMEAHVTPQAASRENSGFYGGFISRIGVFPRSPEQIGEELSGFQAPGVGGEEQNLIEVRVTLVDAPELDTGALCDMTVILRQAKPAELLFGR